MNFSRTRAAVIGLAVFLGGCETSGSLSSGAACEIFKPITGKPGKTPKHIAAQIVEHNAAGVGACGWAP